MWKRSFRCCSAHLAVSHHAPCISSAEASPYKCCYHMMASSCLNTSHGVGRVHATCGVHKYTASSLPITGARCVQVRLYASIAVCVSRAQSIPIYAGAQSSPKVHPLRSGDVERLWHNSTIHTGVWSIQDGHARSVSPRNGPRQGEAFLCTQVRSLA